MISNSGKPKISFGSSGTSSPKKAAILTTSLHFGFRSTRKSSASRSLSFSDFFLFDLNQASGDAVPLLSRGNVTLNPRALLAAASSASMVPPKLASINTGRTSVGSVKSVANLPPPDVLRSRSTVAVIAGETTNLARLMPVPTVSNESVVLSRPTVVRVPCNVAPVKVTVA